MFCALSGETPTVPVVSSKSGQLYEKRLIEKYIAENGTDPVSGEQLALEDLVEIKSSASSAAPRAPDLTSIPKLLITLQNEWDALVLEQFNLKQQYNAVRQELSHSLYQYDAATRVAARLLKERDAAREALASVQAAMGTAPAPASAEPDVEMAESGTQEQTGLLPAAVDEEVVATQARLSAIRKTKPKPSSTYATLETVRTYAEKEAIPSLHASSPSGINAIAVSKTSPSHFLTGGNDKAVQIFDRAEEKVLHTLKGHTKKVYHVAYREDDGSGKTPLVLSGSADKTVRIWSLDSGSGEYAPAQTIKTHKGEISGLAVHPTNNLLAVASADKTYSLHSLASPDFSLLYQSPALEDPLASVNVHPDGILLAVGTTKGKVQIYDLRSGDLAVELPPSVDGTLPSVTTSSFSENGFHFAFPGADSTVGVWDLRKTKLVNAISVGEGVKSINKVAYDTSSQFLGVGTSSGLSVFAHKSWELLTTADKAVTDFAWGVEAKEIVTCAGREVKVYCTAD